MALERQSSQLFKSNQALVELGGFDYDTHSLAEGLQHIARVASQTIDVERVSIWLHDDEQSAIVKTLLRFESARRFWSDQKHSFDSRFTAWVDQEIEAD